MVDCGCAVEDEDVVACAVDLEELAFSHLVEGVLGGVDWWVASRPGEEVHWVLGAEELGGVFAETDGGFEGGLFEELDADHGHVGGGFCHFGVYSDLARIGK